MSYMYVICCKSSVHPLKPSSPAALLMQTSPLMHFLPSARCTDSYWPVHVQLHKLYGYQYECKREYKYEEKDANLTNQMSLQLPCNPAADVASLALPTRCKLHWVSCWPKHREA